MISFVGLELDSAYSFCQAPILTVVFQLVVEFLGYALFKATISFEPLTIANCAPDGFAFTVKVALAVYDEDPPPPVPEPPPP